MESSLNFNKKKQKKCSKYSIITFDMHKPKGNKYPSFDFAKVKKKLGEEDSDEDDERFHDKDALELVRRMEQKYGNMTTKGGRKKKIFNEDDFIDKTLGYDLEDDFIDDTEAHDELVPSTLDTKKGGFYVNKGKLDFVSIGDELSDEEDSEDEADKPKKKKKEEPVASSSKPTAKPAARAPKRPDLKADETKKTVETKAKKRAALSSSDSEGEPQERRLVGGPPTLKRSKQNPAAAPAAKKAEEKKKEEKTTEPRRMAGAPPSLVKKKSEPAARPSLAGKPPSAAAAAAAADPKKTEPAPIETVSSEDEVMVVDEPPKLQAALPAPTGTPIEVNMADVPGPVQVKLVQFRQLATQHMKQGKKFVPPILIDESIQINELTGRLGMKKSLRNLVIEKMAEMVGYSKAGLLQRMNQATRPAASTSVSSVVSTSTVATAATSIATTTTQSQQQSRVAQPVQSTTTSQTASMHSLTPSASSQPGPSTSTTTKQTVIGVKPAGPAVLPKKGAEEKIGMWTREQVTATLAMYPTLTGDMTKLVSQLSFHDFTEHLRNNGQNVPEMAKSSSSSAVVAKEAERDSMEAARKAYRKKLAAQSTDILATLNSHPEILAAMAKFKAATLARYPSLGEKAILCMDFKDDTAGAFNVFMEHALGVLADSPVQILAYLDDAMKKHFGENGRTDRLIRHFAAKLPKHQQPLLEQVKKLPEYIDIGRQFTQREKELQQLVQKENSTSMRPVSGGASSSKPVLKQPPTQTTLISQQQQLQQLMAQQPDKAGNSILTPMQASQIQVTKPKRQRAKKKADVVTLD